MAFEPRGKVAVLVEAMRAAPEKLIWSASEVATVMEVPRGNLPAYLRASIDHRMVFQKVEDGRSFYSLQPFEPVTPAKLLIPTMKKPGDWVPPVMTPPRGTTGYVPRQPLPEPLHQGVAPQPAVAASVVADVEKKPEPADPSKVRRRAAPAPEPEVEAEQVPEAFHVCRWLDGDIDLYGLLETEDGAMRIPAGKVPQLLKLLGGVPT